MMEYIQVNFLLSILLIIPTFGALVVFFANRRYCTTKTLGLFFALLNFIYTCFLYSIFDKDLQGFQFIESYEWISNIPCSYSLGIDGVSLIFVLLTSFLVPLCVALTPRMEKASLYISTLLLLETCCIGVFVALDLLLFFLFFEITLIPLFLMIGIWGGENKVYASFKLLLYTMVGSVVFLLAILYIGSACGTLNIVELQNLVPNMNLEIQRWLWWGFFIAFAIKTPMFPVHTWLPDAHVQAPTAGSVMLAGVLIKIGVYGFFRFSLTFFPEISMEFRGFIYVLSLIAIIYVSLVAMAQQDIKKMIAYSSIAHMGFVTMGLFAMNGQAMKGAIFQMLSHGLISGALFIGVGALYERVRSRKIDDYSNMMMVNRMPVCASFFMLFVISSIGVPGTSGFVGEFLIILGAFQLSAIYAFMMLLGLVLGSVYMLHLYRRVFFSQSDGNRIDGNKKSALSVITDLSVAEFVAFALLGFVIIFLGVYPSPVLELINAQIDNMNILRMDLR